MTSSRYLIGVAADILAHTDTETGDALVNLILDTAEQKGTGKWTSQVALDLGVTAPTIADAVFARTVSAQQPERVAAAKVLTGPAKQPTGERDTVLEKIRRALLAAKICAYAQGFQLLRAADREHQWQLHLPPLRLSGGRAASSVPNYWKTSALRSCTHLT